MLRSGAPRSVLRTLNASTTSTLRAGSPLGAQQWRSQISTIARRPQVLAALKPIAIVRYASDRKAMDNIDTKAEQSIAKHIMEARPGEVSAASSVHPIMGEVGGGRGPVESDTDMMAGVKADMKTIRDTFSLAEVPREAYNMGMAGVLPYLATSLTTVFCAWDIRHAAETGTGFLLSEQTAETILHIVEPLQVGYGAVIISFLGAIHWGLEWAGYDGHKGYARYNIGVFAAALAWPTLLLPVEYALISQFLIFNFLYYTDSRATKRGWAPHWYGVYRFVLTFIVGSAIVASLIGRGQIADRIGKSNGPTDYVRKLRDSQYTQFEDEEEARRQFLAEKDEEADDDEESAEDEELDGESKGENKDDEDKSEDDKE